MAYETYQMVTGIITAIQDQSNDCPPMEAVKKSRDYLKSLGW